MKNPYLLILLVLVFGRYTNAQEDDFFGKELTFPSIDSLKITADLYEADTANSAFIILFHQANFSRGSYRPIAPRLNELGYNCLAVDARSGQRSRKVINKTNRRAVEAKKPTEFKDAVQDIEAAFLYVRDTLKADTIIIWGSSYSASIVFYLGNKYPNDVDGILSFSPGEYFKIDEQDIRTFAMGINCPALISSAKNEQDNWNDIYERIPTSKIYFLPEEKGFHGSKALWPDKKGNKAYWQAVIAFLGTIR